jgi:hypothetical protein
MRFFYFICLIFISHEFIHAQSFPSDAKVLLDVKKYHGKIATAEVQNEWKLERESGYNFSNMAKRVVAATTIKENNVSKKIIGLAIYVRGASTDAWQFSRYFVTGSEVVGAKALTSDDLRQQSLDLLIKDPIQVIVDFKNIAWVYDITFSDISDSRTDRTGDVIYKCFVEYERKFNDTEGITLPNYPFEAGLKRYKTPAEAYVRLVDGQMKVARISLGYSEPLDKKMMSRKEYENLSSLGDKPNSELIGPNCPYFTVNKDQKNISEPLQHQPKATKEDEKQDKKTKKITFPKIKINGL